MIKRIVFCFALAAIALPADSNLIRSAEATELSRTEIRSMPITARPSRPGHFYGNAVRRNQGRTQR